MTADGARTARRATRFADVRRHRQVGSTNDVAAELARSGAAEGVVVVADHQTAGRGRWGRAWAARPGSSLLVSVVLRPAADGGPLTLIPLACGLAAADACLDAAGFAPGLKWPNDLVVDGAKLGGILTEVVPDADGRPPAVVAGLGLNLSWPIEDAAPDGAIAAADQVAGRPVERDHVLDAFLVRLERRYRALGDRGGRAGLLDDYRRRCVTIGQEVRVELPGGGSVEGPAVDVGPDGRLAVREQRGKVRLVGAGDVVHVRPPPNFVR
ncbi:MAG TPA: biotin--[acetyl-CoA-carboxylase] ligase [Acidimicrobiales bacterium]|nr:biotin--[acetyl-CoA-carboxylase] ligase [Acidimicrobiales bacterium]